jgi:ubiquinol-cytochrome c reductase cytochrome b subunit
MSKLSAFLRERTGAGRAPATTIEGGASFAYVFGAVLVFLLAFETVTGLALAAFYAPSATDAWASVAYIEDQSTWGWLVRGAHHHGGGAIVVVAGLHLVQTAVAGAYKKPRELVWWLGLLLLVLVLAWAVTGYVLRWDQAGYWANQVELGITAGTPVVGEGIRKLALGGNDYGNLTLTRFYALHVVALPLLVGGLTYMHVTIARRLGTTPMRGGAAAVPRWPDQSIRDALAMALALAILLGYVASTGGVELAAPADPSQAYDARPLWYFRWLFELRTLAGSAEGVVALLAPAVVGGFLVALPLIDRGPARQTAKRLPWLGAVAGVLALIGGLTAASFAHDNSDAELAKRVGKASERAARARLLARTNGVPTTGPLDVFATAPMWKARAIYAQKCKSCHEDPKERKGPLIGPGHGSRAWFRAFLADPSADAYWGRTKLAKDKDAAMKPVEIKSPELDDLIELLYSESGAADVDKSRLERAVKIFESACTDCHTREEGVAGTSAPSLHGLNSRDYFTSFISNPKKPIHMGTDKSEMPRFDKELTIVERDAIAQYLVWLRTASKADLEALGPL